jgi:hypothetical protein
MRSRGLDTPLLDSLHITFFDQTTFDTPHLSQFIGLTPNFQALEEARVTFSDREVVLALSSQSPTRDFQHELLALGISRDDQYYSVQQLSSLVQVCRSSVLPLAGLERLYICRDRHLQRNRPWVDYTPDSYWIELFHLFTAAKGLYISGELVRRVALTLRGLAEEGTTEVLPALQNLFLHSYRPWGPVGQSIADFVAARQLSGHPIIVRSWSGK